MKSQDWLSALSMRQLNAVCHTLSIAPTSSKNGMARKIKVTLESGLGCQAPIRTAEDLLGAMTYRELRKLAKALGVIQAHPKKAQIARLVDMKLTNRVAKRRRVPLPKGEDTNA